MRRIALVVVLIALPLVAAARPKQGEGCDKHGRCARHLVCVRYRGFAGAKGPEMNSCELRCHDGGCPAGQECVTIADGPGEVCRPTK